MLSELLSKYMKNMGYGDSKVAQLVNKKFGQLVRINRNNLYLWRNEINKTVRDWRQIVAIAAVLHLNFQDADELIRSAGHVNGLQWLFLCAAKTDEKPLFANWVFMGQMNLPIDRLPNVHTFKTIKQIPFANDVNFVGRKAELIEIARLFNELGGGKAISIAGSPGIGKTQLAIEFAHRYGRFFDGGVYWFNAENSADLKFQIANSGSKEGLNLFSDSDHLDLDVRLENVLRRGWGSPDARLIVFDNCEEEEIVNLYLPYMLGSRMLVTSRSGGWTHATTFHLAGLGSREGLQLLRTNASFVSEDDAVAITDYIGNAPLGLLLAGKYLAKTYGARTDVTDYIRDLSIERFAHKSLTDVTGKGLPMDYTPNLGKVISTSFKRIHQPSIINQLAFQILGRVVRLAPGVPFPRLIIVQSLHLEEGMNEIDVLDAFDRLIKLGLIIPVQSLKLGFDKSRWARVHHYIASFVRDETKGTDFDETVEHFIENWATKSLEKNHIHLFDEWQSHLLYVTRNALDTASLGSIRLGLIAGKLLKLQGRYQEAFAYVEKTHQVCMQNYGDQNRETIESLVFLGDILLLLSNYQEAQKYLETAVWQLQDSKYSDTLIKARCLNRLGTVYQMQEKFEEAKVHFLSAINIQKMSLGEDHPDTASSLNDLALLLSNQAKYKDAKRYYFQALKTQIKLLGEQHLDTAETLNNLGILYYYLEEYAQALSYMRRAFTVRKAELGEIHPITANSMHNIGFCLLKAEKNFTEVKRLFERALEINSVVYGEAYIGYASSLNSLGVLMKAQAKHPEARIYFERALAVCEKIVVEDYRLIATLNFYIGETEEMQGKLNGAIPFYMRACDIRMKILEPDHPHAVVVWEKLGKLLLAINRHQQAEQHISEIIRLLEQKGLSKSPASATAYQILDQIANERKIMEANNNAI